MAPKKETMSLNTVVMTPTQTNPSPRSRPQPVPPAAPSADPPVISAIRKTADAPASASLVERPYAPVLPPATHSHEREGVEALVGLASTSQRSPTTASLTSSFSAVNVATTHNGHHDSYMRTSTKHDHSCNISCLGTICSNGYSPNTAQPLGVPEDIGSNDGSSSRARRRRRSNSPGIESPRGHRKPYDGHVLKEDTVMGGTGQPRRASSPGNSPQVPQQDAHPVPHQIESKKHSRRERQHLHPQYQPLSPRPQQALPQTLPYRSQQPTVHYAKQTNVPQMPNTQLPRTYTVDVHGFTVLRNTVPTEVAQAAASILDGGMKEVGIDATYKVFGLFPQALRVKDEFMGNEFMGNVSVHLSYLPSLGSSLLFFESDFNSYAVKSTAVVTSLPQLVLSYFYSYSLHVWTRCAL